MNIFIFFNLIHIKISTSIAKSSRCSAMFCVYNKSIYIYQMYVRLNIQLMKRLWYLVEF